MLPFVVIEINAHSGTGASRMLAKYNHPPSFAAAIGPDRLLAAYEKALRSHPLNGMYCMSAYSLGIGYPDYLAIYWYDADENGNPLPGGASSHSIAFIPCGEGW